MVKTMKDRKSVFRKGLEVFFVFLAALLCLPNLAAGEDSGHDLTPFLTSVEVTGAELNGAGQYIILEDVPYSIVMTFREKTNGIQFPDDPEGDGFTYHFPNGFTPQPDTGTAEITGDGGKVFFHYKIEGNTLTVTFDRDSPGYQSFILSETAEFSVYIRGIISREEIAFSTEVSGEYEIDDSREVSVEKTGDYDPALNKIKYTIRAYSRGNNTNVHIGDIITGTALSYDPNSLRVTSSLYDDPVHYQADTRTGETFGLTFPTMSHGETVTVEYWADVNLSALTGTGKLSYGTVEETGNTVRVSSEENPPGDETTVYAGDFEHKISLSTNCKTATAESIREDKTYITWTVVLNENANISIAGSTVTDTIDEACRPFMRYSGSGIHIERFWKDGTLAGTSDIPWGTNGLIASGDGSSWTYTIPAADAEPAYKYVITYETEVDSDTFLKTTTVSNTLENEYDRDYGAIDIGTTGEAVTAVKSAAQSTVDAINKEAETEWEITFTVPTTGLDNAVIIDTLPGFYDYASGVTYYDTFKSARYRDGDLLDGEDMSIESTPENHQVTISFTRNNGETGLTGTGLTRTIHVYLTTTASHEWLVHAENESRARTHVNNAVLRVNGQDLYLNGSASYNTTLYDLEKTQAGTYATSTDPALPIYVYKIILTNVNDNAFDAQGFLTITDTYDAGYLSFHPVYETNDGYNVNTPNGHVYGNNQWNKYGMVMRGPYVVDDDSSTDGQLIFRLNKNELPLSGTSYYPYYAIVYALQIKDAETLARMKEEALHADGLKVSLANTAANEEFGTNTIVTEYTINALEKSKDWEQYNQETGTYDIRFSIEVNPDGLKIGDADTITVRDTLSNLSFDYTSIDVEPWLDGDTLNRAGNSVIFSLHNETSYTIAYTTRLIGLHEVHWNNKAELFGRTAGVSGRSFQESGGTGSYRTYSMNVKKYAEGNMNKGLAATFDIFEARVKDSYGQEIPDAEWVKIGSFTTDGATGLYEIKSLIRPGKTDARSLRAYSYHDGAGTELFGADGSEDYGWRYRITETVAPVGYQKKTTVYDFGISDIPSYNTKPYHYLNNDTITIANKPGELSANTVIPGQKVLIGKELENQEFTFSLTPEESVKASWGPGYPGGFDGVLTVQNDKAGYFSFALSFTYDDFTKAEQKGFMDTDHRATFYYVVREELPEGSEDNFWHGVRYDASQFLVVVRLSLDGDQLKAESTYYPYDGNGIPDDLQPGV